MTVAGELVAQVRERAGFACEFCGVAETDSGGQLTVDHFRPRALGGSETLENLLYCCFRCNLYKADYWPRDRENVPLWNPRQDSAQRHWLQLTDGALQALTPCGEFTIRRLRLNRAQLISYRLRKEQAKQEELLLARYRDLVGLLEQMSQQHRELLAEQHALLLRHRELLEMQLAAQKRKG